VSIRTLILFDVDSHGGGEDAALFGSEQSRSAKSVFSLRDLISNHKYESIDQHGLE
jgi:hypothetical protein